MEDDGLTAWVLSLLYEYALGRHPTDIEQRLTAEWWERREGNYREALDNIYRPSPTKDSAP